MKRMKGQQQPEPKKLNNGKRDRLIARYGSGAGRFMPAHAQIVKGEDGGYFYNADARRRGR